MTRHSGKWGPYLVQRTEIRIRNTSNNTANGSNDPSAATVEGTILSTHNGGDERGAEGESGAGKPNGSIGAAHAKVATAAATGNIDDDADADITYATWSSDLDGNFLINAQQLPPSTMRLLGGTGTGTGRPSTSSRIANTYDIVLVATPHSTHTGTTQSTRRPFLVNSTNLVESSRSAGAGAETASELDHVSALRMDTSGGSPTASNVSRSKVKPIPAGSEAQARIGVTPIGTINGVAEADVSHFTCTLPEREALLVRLLPDYSLANPQKACHLPVRAQGRQQQQADQPQGPTVSVPPLSMSITEATAMVTAEAQQNAAGVTAKVPLCEASVLHLLQMPGRLYHRIGVYGMEAYIKQSRLKTLKPVTSHLSMGHSVGLGPEDSGIRDSGSGSGSGSHRDSAVSGNTAEVVEIEANAECLVCMTDRKNTIMFPCRHMCVCETCAAALSTRPGTKRCPLCRNAVVVMLQLKGP